jgi:phage recombination protein Bet
MTDNTPGTDVAVHADTPRTTELAIRPDQSRFDDTQLAALRALGVENAPKGDVDLLFHQSVRLGLDPFAKQIYLIGRDERKKINGTWQTVGKKYTIQTGIDGFRVVRDRTKIYDGQELAWCGPDGIWADVWTKPQPPVAARVLIYVKGRSRPEPGIAYYTEYAQTDAQGNPQAMWKKMPAGQLAKCAEALALRKAFPQDLSGVYVDEEMQQADIGTDGVPSVTSVQRGRTVEQDHDGPNVTATMRETKTGAMGDTGKRGVANETQVMTASDREPTPAPSKRPGGSRTASKPAPGPAEPTRDHNDVFREWADRIDETMEVAGLIKLHTEAAERNILDIRHSGGLTIEGAFLARRQELLDAQAQAAAEEPTPATYDDETPF